MLKNWKSSCMANIFYVLTNGEYVEEFWQQAPTLDEIFRMEDC